MKTASVFILVFFNLFFLVFTSESQNIYTVYGFVKDGVTKEPVSGATIQYSMTKGTKTDMTGYYHIQLSDTGKYNFRYSNMGYETIIKTVVIGIQKDNEINVSLFISTNQLEQIVVTASKSKQNLKDITVSMEILLPKFISNLNPMSMDNVLNQVAGVTVTKEQIKIREGSGYSYGAGSRVLVLVDGLPLLSGDLGDIKWTLLPLDNIEQVEVIKGASSALYGASALDGIINIRTSSAGNIPQSNVLINTGIYGDPPRKEWKFWKNPPIFNRLLISHSRIIGDWKINIGAESIKDDSYRVDENSSRQKVYIKLEHFPEKIAGLKYGVNATFLNENKGAFMYWLNLDSAYYPAPNTISRLQTRRYVIDPYIKYTDKKNNKHSVLTRIFINEHKTDDNHDSKSNLYYAEYQFQKDIKFSSTFDFKLSSGLVVSYAYADSKDMYGKHNQKNMAAYAQLDKKLNRFNFSIGGRAERFQTDSLKNEIVSVFRSGISISLAPATYLRASIGQGFRHPSISERFILTHTGSIYLLPNPEIKPEKGWSSEIGIKQGYAFNKFKGFADLAGFYSRYNDMIEFRFNQYQLADNSYTFGFKALNLENTKVYGFESTTSLLWEGKIISAKLSAGYTFTVPLNINYVKDPVNDTLGTEKYLKYRSQHSFKADLQVDYKIVSIGGQFKYTSFMMNIDPVFNLIIPGVEQFRKENNNGYYLFDVFVNFKIFKQTFIGLYIRNLFNCEYMEFPGNIGIPRNYSALMKIGF